MTFCCAVRLSQLDQDSWTKTGKTAGWRGVEWGKTAGEARQLGGAGARQLGGKRQDSWGVRGKTAGQLSWSAVILPKRGAGGGDIKSLEEWEGRRQRGEGRD